MIVVTARDSNAAMKMSAIALTVVQMNCGARMLEGGAVLVVRVLSSCV
jgi:hypothetical protein